MMPLPYRLGSALVGGLLLLAAGSAAGQQPGPGQTPYPGQSPPTQVRPLPQEPTGQPVQRLNEWDHPFSPHDTGAAPQQGFPLFPPALQGYGGYPPPPKALTTPPEAIDGAAPPPQLPLPPDWPSWVQLKSGRPLPYAADLAVLVRSADRVWFRPPDEPAFVPLYFFDKMRALPAGSEIEVRQSGEFQLLCHGGTRVYSFGPAALRIQALAADRVQLQFAAFTHLRIVCRGPAHEILLPDGSALRVAAEGEERERQGAVDLHLERDGGRATVFQGGRRSATLHTPFGDQVLAPGHRSTILLQPPTSPVPAPLQHDAISVTRRDGALECEGAEGGALQWSGARFPLPPGTRLRLDPLQGRPFDPPPPTPAPPASRPDGAKHP